MKLRCLIVDDEKPARELLVKYCNEVPFLEVIGECKNAFEAIEFLSSCDVDLLFLDIKMPKLNGIQLLQSLNNQPHVIITTAFREYAYQGYEHDAVDYLKKPFSYERFLKASLKVKKLNEQTKDSVENHAKVSMPANQTDYLFINSDKSIYKIVLDELLYVSAMGDYSHFITKGNKYVAYYALKKVEMLLPQSQFIRVHRSFIIALKHIDYVEGNMIYLGETAIPIGKSFKELFLKRLT